MSHGELAAPALLALASVLVPLGWTECYPYSRMAIFTDVEHVNAVYEIRSANGDTLPLARFHLQRQYWALQGFSRRHPEPHPGAVVTPATIHRFGVVNPEHEVRATVRQVLQPGETVEIAQRVIGPVGRRIDTITEQTWTVSR